MATTPGHITRTKGEALLDLDFAIEYSILNQRFYERVDKAIALISLLAGSAAFVTVFAPNSVVVTVSGVLVGTLSLIAQVYDFRGKGAAHAALVRSLQKVKSRSAKLDLVQLDAALDKVAMDAIPGIRGLKLPAYNNNVLRAGYVSYMQPLTKWQRLLDWVT